jgi:hypothetical protein
VTPKSVEKKKKKKTKMEEPEATERTSEDEASALAEEEEEAEPEETGGAKALISKIKKVRALRLLYPCTNSHSRVVNPENKKILTPGYRFTLTLSTIPMG